jgi:hypothetical protein
MKYGGKGSGDETSLESFANFLTLVTAFEDTLKKAQDIRQVKPESTIDTSGIKPT